MFVFNLKPRSIHTYKQCASPWGFLGAGASLSSAQGLIYCTVPGGVTGLCLQRGNSLCHVPPAPWEVKKKALKGIKILFGYYIHKYIGGERSTLCVTLALLIPWHQCVPYKEEFSKFLELFCLRITNPRKEPWRGPGRSGPGSAPSELLWHHHPVQSALAELPLLPSQSNPAFCSSLTPIHPLFPLLQL